MATVRATVTLADVARVTGVSVQTVSNALNAPYRVRPSTRDRVLSVVDQMGYRANRNARSLRTARSHAIGMRVQEPTEQGQPLLDRFIHSLARAARARDYWLLIYGAGIEDEVQGQQDLVRAAAVDAFVLTDTRTGDPRVANLDRLDVPFVAFGRPWGELQTATHPWIDIDGAAGTQSAVEHLVARGRRHIAFLGWEAGSATGDDRQQGWHRALHFAGLTPGPVLRAVNEPDPVADTVTDALDQGTAFDAIVCCSDIQAAGVYRALDRRGMQPGRDIAVVGFDDTPLAKQLPIPLTTLSQPIEQVADRMVDLLVVALGGGIPDEPAVILTPTLAVRSST